LRVNDRADVVVIQHGRQLGFVKSGSHVVHAVISLPCRSAAVGLAAAEESQGNRMFLPSRDREGAAPLPDGRGSDELVHMRLSWEESWRMFGSSIRSTRFRAPRSSRAATPAWP